MTADDRRRVLERFVAGLPVGPDELANAITARAVERSVVVQAIVDGLADPEPIVRRRFARRARRMPELDPAIAGQLGVLAARDDDPRASEASAAALHAHGLAVPGKLPSGVAPAEPAPGGGLLLRLLVAGGVRGGQDQVRVVPRWRDDAEALSGRCFADGSGVPRLELESLPPAWVGTVPELRAIKGPAGPVVLGIAAAPVAADASVTIPIRVASGSTAEDVLAWLPRADLELSAAAV